MCARRRGGSLADRLFFDNETVPSTSPSMSRPAQIPKTSRGLVAVNQPIAAGHSLRVMIALSSCRRRATSPQPDAWLPTSRTSGTSKCRWHQHLPEKVVPHREHAISTCACHPCAAPTERRIPERRRHMAQAEIATDVVGWVTWLAGAHAGPIGRKKRCTCTNIRMIS